MDSPRPEISIKDIVKDNVAKISFYRAGNVFYNIVVSGITYVFPVSLEDIGGASLFAEEKAITMMRFIRKSREQGTFRPATRKDYDNQNRS